MMQWIGHTKIDFMAWFPACATFSVVITVLGLVIAVVRGQGLFDIDFTGGVSVQTVFQKEQKIDDIRAQINTVREKLPDATVTNAHSQDEPENQRFIIDTSNSNNEEVENTLKKLFDENPTGHPGIEGHAAGTREAGTPKQEEKNLRKRP